MSPPQMTDSAARPPALKNADAMLSSIMRSVDTNGDGQIDYPGKITRFVSWAVPGAAGFCQFIYQPNPPQNSGTL